MNEDTIYIDEKLGDEPFRFDDSVARVFPDMLQRSIPGYAASLEAIGSLASRYVKSGTNCYDLGCSLGAASLAMRQGIRVPDCQIIAIDNSEAMVERCKAVVANDETGASQTPVGISLADIRDVNIENASMVVMNYTLQFVDLDARDALIGRIFDGLLPGGLQLRVAGQRAVKQLTGLPVPAGAGPDARQVEARLGRRVGAGRRALQERDGLRLAVGPQQDRGQVVEGRRVGRDANRP